MDPIAVSRSIAKLQYAAVRLPLTVVEERVVASQWGEGAPVRLGFELSLGWLDRFAGWLLDDEQISRRGQALLQRTGRPAKAGAPETKAPVRSAPTRASCLPGQPTPGSPAGRARTWATKPSLTRSGKTSARFALRPGDG